EGLEQFESQIRDQLIFTPENWPGLEDFFAYQATLKTTWAVLQWIDEEKEEMICDQFGVGPGDIYRHVESTQWLVYAAISIANMLHFKKLTFALEQLRNRIRYGIKEELLELVQLRGVGRVRARKLFDHGFKHYTDLRSVSLPKLAEVPQIGKTIAQDILQQVATRE
ncbi:MAG: helix-hairpin-helix domain-containing protein, partial [Candidatus Omnitrophota bacterium]|nr:helix-hairpin-helix domain-containing protein [Candidatus Omnitrophota bacterium]